MLSDSILALESTDDYFCLSLSERNSTREIGTALSLLKATQVKFLDITFNEQIKENVDKLRSIIPLISYLRGTKVERLDLSCNALHKIGIDGLQRLLLALPSNITTLTLSGNNWNELGFDAKTLVQKIQALTKVEVKFEGTDEFEYELTLEMIAATLNVQAAANPHRMFKGGAALKEKGTQQASLHHHGCVIC